MIHDLACLKMAEKLDFLSLLKQKTSVIKSWPWLFRGTFLKRGLGDYFKRKRVLCLIELARGDGGC